MDVMFSYIIMCGILFPFFANSTPINANEKSEINWQNFQITLLSIEEKLQSLESFVIVQCGTRFNGKIDYYGRKIDNIEKTLSKLEMQTKVELEKISENISSKNFKEDIGNDRIFRKIDSIYEKMDHKLTAIGEHVDLTNMKMKNIGETLTTKLEKIEENLTIRDADIEAELSDVVAAIDDLKITSTNFKNNTVNLITQSNENLLKNSEQLLTKQYARMETILDAATENISENFQNIQENVQMILIHSENATNIVTVSQEEIIENLNEYANKIIDIHSDLWKKSDTITSKVQQLSKTVNLSRNEQQNSLRGLTVQLGRLSGKPDMLNNSLDYGKLEDLSKKIDDNFRDVMLTQNLFLESCYRVQMDEAQIESQISMVLNKLIDIFENKTSVRIEDFRHLEQTIRTHDTNTRRGLQLIINNLQEFLKTVINEHTKITENFDTQKENLEIVHILLRDILNSQDGRILQNMRKILKDLEKQTSETQLLKVALQQNFNLNVSKFVEFINRELNSIKTKIENCANTQKNLNQSAITDLIDQIFYKKSINNQFIIDNESFNVTKTELDNIITALNNSETSCEKIDNYTFSIVENDNFTIISCLPLYIDLIDVRYNSNEDEFLHCTILKLINEEEARNCLPNYLDLIDVRFNRDNFTSCINSDVETTQRVETGCLSNYANLIDVRFNANCNVIDTTQKTDTQASTPNYYGQEIITSWDDELDTTTEDEVTLSSTEH